jgi:hypothetical protein
MGQLFTIFAWTAFILVSGIYIGRRSNSANKRLQKQLDKILTLIADILEADILEEHLDDKKYFIQEVERLIEEIENEYST